MRIDAGLVLKAMGFEFFKDYEVTDDGTGNVTLNWLSQQPKPSDAEIDAFDLIGYQVQQQALIDREAKIQAVMRGLAISILDGKTDPVEIVADAASAVSAVDVKP